LDALNAKTPLPDFEQEKQRLCTYLCDFNEPPFTLQRLCELLVGPAGEVYKTTKAYAFAIEKVLCVTTTQSTLQPEEHLHTVIEYTRRMNELKKIDDQENNSRKRPNIHTTSSDMESTPKKPMLTRTGTPASLNASENSEKEEQDHGSPSQRRGTVPTTTVGEGNDGAADMMDVDKD